MSKKAISITTVVILLILVAVVAPYFIGAKVETEFREGIAQAKTEYGYPIELTDFERGWLHSHAVTRVQIEDTTFDVEHEITHGPLFVGLLIAVIVVLGGLTFFPALALGPLAEQFAMTAGTVFGAP